MPPAGHSPRPTPTPPYTPQYPNNIPTQPTFPPPAAPPYTGSYPYNIPSQPQFPSSGNGGGAAGYQWPTSGGGGGGGGGGGFAEPPAPTGPGGNWFDPNAGPHGEWKDAWGNVIPHMNYGYNDQGQPDLPQYGGPGTTAPTPGTVPAPPGQGPYNGTFYAPTAASNTLTLPDNFLALLAPDVRATLNQQLQGLGFSPTGQFGTYGESMYLRPEQFQASDLDRLSDPALRQWLKFFLGLSGYGLSYALPGPWSGPGLPPAPPMSAPPAPPTGGPTPAPAPPVPLG